MKALLLNGSPRKGNTVTALEALKRGLENISGLETFQIDAADMNVSPCSACRYCRSGGGPRKCVHDDDTNAVMNAVIEADLLVFATPVYWWGVTAQLKTILDKFYSCLSQLASCKKQIGVIVVGQLPQGNPQYEIIPKQFRCICDYLGWDMAFCKTYTADEATDLANNKDAAEEIETLWRTVHL